MGAKEGGREGEWMGGRENGRVVECESGWMGGREVGE